MPPLEIGSAVWQERLFWTLLHSLWQITALVALLLFLEGVIKLSASVNYRLHVSALLLCLICLPSTFISLSSVTAPHPEASVESVAHSAAVNSDRRQVLTDPIFPPVQEANVLKFASDNENETLTAASANLPPQISLSTIGIAFYFVGVMFMVGRFVRSLMNLRYRRRTAQPLVDDSITAMAHSISGKWGIRTTPAILVSPIISVPQLIGIFRPAILLPMAMFSGVPHADLELLLKHEIAHIRRHDMSIVLLQRIVEVFLFFNPALWYLSHKISRLREYCCDDLTCEGRSNSSQTLQIRYASALLKIAEQASPQHSLTSVAVSGNSPSELRRRIARLLGDPIREPMHVTRGGLLTIACLTIACCLPSIIQAVEQKDTQTVESNDDAPAKEQSHAKLSPNVKSFSFGGKVELVAINMIDEDKETNWDANGKRIKESPLIWTIQSAIQKPGSLIRRVAVRVSGLPEGAEYSQKILESSTFSGSSQIDETDGVPHVVYIQEFAVDPELETFTIRIGGAAGNWRTELSQKGTGTSASGSENHAVVMTGPFTANNKLVCVVSHNHFDTNYRIVAFDKQGKLHESDFRGGSSAGSIYQSQGIFSNLKLENLDRVEFQTREYEWIEFKDLPLFPHGAKTKTAQDGIDRRNNTPSVIIAKHAILYNQTEIVTWEDVKEKLKQHENVRKLAPAFYFTHGVLNSPKYDVAKKNIYQLHKDLQLNGHSEGTFSVQAAFRYDQIHSDKDLEVDPAQASVGTIVNSNGQPVSNAEVVLISPLDESIPYRGYHVYLVKGRIRNRLEHVLTISTADGTFAVQPPSDGPFYILATHPEYGFALVEKDHLLRQNGEIRLLPWGKLDISLEAKDGEKQNVSLSTLVAARNGLPEISIQQYWSDVADENEIRRKFNYAHVPPFQETHINRSFPYEDGGSTSINSASVRLLDSEQRSIGLGRISQKQIDQVNLTRQLMRRQEADQKESE